MSRRFQAISIVVALAVIAVVVISHRNHPRHRNAAGGPALVLVANKPIQKGTTGDAIRTVHGLYSVVSVQPRLIEGGAIVDPSELVGKVALTDIAQGQQLTAADFGRFTMTGPGSPWSDERAVVITSPEETGGTISAGSHVDVWVARKRSGKLRELDRDLEVLEVGPNIRTVTLRARSQQAGELIYVMQRPDHRVVLRLHN